MHPTNFNVGGGAGRRGVGGVLVYQCVLGSLWFGGLGFRSVFIGLE